MADIYVAAILFQYPYNECYEKCHILQAVVERYPKVTAYCSQLLNDFKFWRELQPTNISQNVVLGYWTIRGLAASIRYHLIYSGIDFENKLYKVGDPPLYNKDSWLRDK